MAKPMDKSKRYARIGFHARLIRKAVEACRSFSQGNAELIGAARVWIGNEKWNFDNLEEFLVRYPYADSAELQIWWKPSVLFYLQLGQGRTDITFGSNTRATIESLFSIFEEAPADDKIVIQEKRKVSIFIGHGRKREWEKLKSHLQDKHKLDVIAYETGARAGHTIRDILQSMSNQASFALLVLTGEDKSEDGLRARQNVIHECGLFQGKLGFDRAIMLVEKGIELGSNFDGIQQLRFGKGRIAEAFGDVIATIKREFGPV
jgi:predicted nucleotide-binding protein